MKNNDRFDLWRGGSALAVVAAHSYQIFWLRLLGQESILTDVFFSLARFAVLVFFVLSGYLITTSICTNIQKNGTFLVSDYAFARIARIYPPFLGAIILMGVCGAIIHYFQLPGGAVPYGLQADRYVVREYYELPWQEFPAALLLLGGLTSANGPLWSLYIECQSYLLAAIIALALLKSDRRPSLLALSVALIALFSYFNFLFVFFAAIWGVGAIAAMIVNGGVRMRHVRRLFEIAAIVSLCVVAATALLEPRLLSVVGHYKKLNLIYQLGGCVIVAWWLFLLERDGSYPKFLIRPAHYSYTLYVIHFPILLLVLSLFTKWMGMDAGRTVIISLIGFALAIVLALLISKVLERPRYFRTLLVKGWTRLKPPRWRPDSL